MFKRAFGVPVTSLPLRQTLLQLRLTSLSETLTYRFDTEVKGNCRFAMKPLGCGREQVTSVCLGR
jgi:hypothetical protein